MKAALLLGISVMSILGLTGCGASGKTEESKNGYHKISAREAKEMMENGNVTVLDVRTPEEFLEGRIPGAVNLPNEEIGGEEPELLEDKDAVLLIYCRSGRRSSEAAHKLAELGYTQIYDFGGILDWPYETVKEE